MAEPVSIPLPVVKTQIFAPPATIALMSNNIKSKNGVLAIIKEHMKNIRNLTN